MEPIISTFGQPTKTESDRDRQRSIRELRDAVKKEALLNTVFPLGAEHFVVNLAAVKVALALAEKHIDAPFAERNPEWTLRYVQALKELCAKGVALFSDLER